MVNRKEQIDYLMRRRFGSLAPPPAPTLDRLRTTLDASMEEARYQQTLAVAGLPDRRPTIESARAEYEALSASALQELVDRAVEEDVRKGKQWADDVQAKRERCWPRWARKDLWSEAEFAALCCGFVPDERGMPSDPGKTAGGDFQAVAINRASDDIRRGTLSKLLAFVPRDDADTAAKLYGTARHYVPAVAAEWAASRFETFPASLLSALKERAGSGHGNGALDLSHGDPRAKGALVSPTVARWPWGDHETDLLRKLAAAADKFWKLYDPADASTAPTNEAVAAWLKGQGVADRNAQVMATILRADGLPTGPRK